MILASLAILLALQSEPPTAPPSVPPPVPPTVPPTEPTPVPEPTPEPTPQQPEPREPAPPPAPPSEPAPEPAPQPTPPREPPVAPPATEPSAPPPAEAPKSEPTVPDGSAATIPPAPTPINPAGIPSEEALPEEKPKRAYIVVDRVTATAGQIETDDDAIIVLRDDKGRIKSFSKSRVISVTYLLEGPVGRRVRIYFNDGRVIVANLVEDGYEHLEVEISGIKTKYPREAVAAVRPYPTDREMYERFRTTLEPDQFSARYTLALWLYNKKMYAEAKTELESLLDATNHYEAKRLLVEVNAQLELLAQGGRPADGDKEGNGANTVRERAGDAKGPLGSPLLSDAEVNLIRVYELDLNMSPRVQVPRSLIKTLLEKYADNELIPAKKAEKDAFYSKEPLEIVKTLFALKARDLYGEIKVVTEPESLSFFKRRVHDGWLIANCATSRCHGGPDAGRFFLHNRDSRDDNPRYTNLLILLRSRFDTLPLVDPEKPTDSLLFQYALPKTEARRPHPDVRGWTPALTSGRRNLQEDFVDWIRLMRLPRGDYPIEYVPPGLRLRDETAPAGPDR
ncbi:MAG: hypothetical protein RIT24_2345 [Planctomycetota bacterium]